MMTVELLLTQADLLPAAGGQQEDQQGHGGEQHAWDKQVQGVVQGPPPQGHHEGHVRVRRHAAVVEVLVTSARHPWGGRCTERYTGCINGPVIGSVSYMIAGVESNSKNK